jgi:hypothetical protein
LFQKLVDYFRARGTREIVGDACRRTAACKTDTPFRRRGIAASGSRNGASAVTFAIAFAARLIYIGDAAGLF